MKLSPSTSTVHTLRYRDVESRFREVNTSAWPHPEAEGFMGNSLYHVGPEEVTSPPSLWDSKRHMGNFLNFLHRHGEIPAGLYFISDY